MESARTHTGAPVLRTRISRALFVARSSARSCAFWTLRFRSSRCNSIPVVPASARASVSRFSKSAVVSSVVVRIFDNAIRYSSAPRGRCSVTSGQRPDYGHRRAQVVRSVRCESRDPLERGINSFQHRVDRFGEPAQLVFGAWDFEPLREVIDADALGRRDDSL